MNVLSAPILAVLVLLTGPALAQSSAGEPQAKPPQQEAQDQKQRQAAQPGNNAPVWREVQSGAPNFTTVQGRETPVLIQPPARFLGQEHRTTAGEAWRQFRNGPVTFYGGWLVVLVALAILAFYFAKGPVKLHGAPTGRQIHRFSTLEQVAHWSTAISFCVLGISGLIMLFGKHVLLPLMGYTLFSWLTLLGKNLHNFIAPLFIVSVLAMVVLFIRDNVFKAYDWQWFRRAWAWFARAEHIPTGRFNAGEKAWFWLGVIGLSVAVSWSGLVLLFPNFDQTRAVMQDAWVVHASVALVYIAISLGHIYMGTIGVEGSYRAMREGYVDEAWAREHHEIWYNEIKSGRRPEARGPVPVGAPQMKEHP
jgi:formate dehydrogenase subunit gamma